MNNQSGAEQELSQEEMEKLFKDTYASAVASAQPDPSPLDSPKAKVEKESDTPEPSSPKKEDTPAVPTPEKQDEWLSKLDEDARKEFDNLRNLALQNENNWKREQGRTRKALEEKQALEKRLALPPEPVKAKEKGDETSDFNKYLKEVEEVDEGLAKAIRAAKEEAVAEARKEYQKELATLRKEEIAPVHVRQQEDYVNQQEYALTQAVPNWKEIVAHPQFTEYLGKIPKQVQELADSPHAQDVLYLLGDYSRYLDVVYGPAQTETKQKGGDPEAERVAKERESKLSKSVVPAAVSHKTKVSEDDPDSLQALFEKTKRETIQRLYRGG